MNIQEIIETKRDNNKLSKEQIEYFITNYTNGDITDYQAAALIMAIYINGMDEFGRHFKFVRIRYSSR